MTRFMVVRVTSLFGGQQDDLLYGQVDDRIDGNRGNDTLFGDDGIDTFVISKGDDWVMDFNTAQDKIETAGLFSHHPICIIQQSCSHR